MGQILDKLTYSDNYVNKLRLLDLRSNQLSHVPKQIRLFTQLTRVNLGNNKIRSIKSEDFKFSQIIDGTYNSKGLQLWLNDNHLRTIEPRALEGITIGYILQSELN